MRQREGKKEEEKRGKDTNSSMCSQVFKLLGTVRVGSFFILFFEFFFWLDFSDFFVVYCTLVDLFDDYKARNYGNNVQKSKKRDWTKNIKSCINRCTIHKIVSSCFILFHSCCLPKHVSSFRVLWIRERYWNYRSEPAFKE